jgi:hypothetical protein
MRKCPKCRSVNLQLSEQWTYSISWDQDQAGLMSKTGDAEPGDPYCVEAKCKNCGHGWRLRGISQITDLYPDLHEFPGDFSREA